MELFTYLRDIMEYLFGVSSVFPMAFLCVFEIFLFLNFLRWTSLDFFDGRDNIFYLNFLYLVQSSIIIFPILQIPFHLTINVAQNLKCLGGIINITMWMFALHFLNKKVDDESSCQSNIQLFHGSMILILWSSLCQSLLQHYDRICTIISWVISFLTVSSLTYKNNNNETVKLLPLYMIIYGIILLKLEWNQIERKTKDKKVRDDMNTEIQLCNATLKDAIANAAHDLKTPLQSFTMGLEAMESLLRDLSASYGNSVDSHVQAGLGTITALSVTSSLMSMAINRSTDYSRLSRGIKLRPEREPVFVSDAVSWAVKCMVDIQSRIPVTLNMSEHCSKISLFTDKSWLQDNIFCLLTNAVKYSESGDVKVRLSDCYVDHQRESSIAGSESFCIEVEDSGVGSPDELRDLMHKPQLPETRAVGGAGLGLYCLSMRTQALGGSCGVSARPDGQSGVIMWFTIPYGHSATESDTCSDSEHELVDRVEKLGLHSSSSSHSLHSASSENLFHSLRGLGDTGENICPVSNLVRKQSFSLNSLSFDAAETSTESLPALRRQSSLCLSMKSELKPDEEGIRHTEFSSDEPMNKASTPKKILVVDDSLMILKMTVKALRQEGFEVDQAENGAVALSLLMENTYDMVLMDVQMPVMDGIEAVKRLRKYEEQKQQEIIQVREQQQQQLLIRRNSHRQLVLGVSACSDEVTKEAALRAGMDYFIAKPFSLERFKKILSAWNRM